MRSTDHYIASNFYQFFLDFDVVELVKKEISKQISISIVNLVSKSLRLLLEKLKRFTNDIFEAFRYKNLLLDPWI